MSGFDHFAVLAPLFARLSYSQTEVLREAASLPVQGRLLEVGGGTGRAAAAIHGLVDEVIVSDISLGMLQKASHPALLPVCNGSETLPFADDSFERVIMVDALHHVIDRDRSVREMYRVLKPGGVLVIEEPDIRTFGIKLVAIAEKVLLMRSHFLTPDQIVEMCSSFAGGEKQVKVVKRTAWIIKKK